MLTDSAEKRVELGLKYYTSYHATTHKKQVSLQTSLLKKKKKNYRIQKIIIKNKTTSTSYFFRKRSAGKGNEMKSLVMHGSRINSVGFHTIRVKKAKFKLFLRTF